MHRERLHLARDMHTVCAPRLELSGPSTPSIPKLPFLASPLHAMQPAPGDTTTLLHPKYQVSSSEAPHGNGATPALPASGLEHAAAAAGAFNQVEAAAAGFSNRSDDSATGMSSHTYAQQLLEAMLCASNHLSLLHNL